MGADFIFSCCRIPGLPQDEFLDAVTEKIMNMPDGEWEELLRSLEDHCLMVEGAYKREDIVKRIVTAERELSNGPRDLGSLTLDDKDYYISGLLSHGDSTESMEDITWLVVTGCEELGHD